LYKVIIHEHFAESYTISDTHYSQNGFPGFLRQDTCFHSVIVLIPVVEKARQHTAAALLARTGTQSKKAGLPLLFASIYMS